MRPLPDTALSRPVDHVDGQEVRGCSGRSRSVSTGTKGLRVAVAFDVLGVELGGREIATTEAGYRDLLGWARRLGVRRSLLRAAAAMALG